MDKSHTTAARVPAKRILVVEDEFVTAYDLKLKLLQLGYEVPAVVDTGEEAILKAAELRPDLILMDILLLGPMSGIQAAVEIQTNLAIPIVFLTAHADAETIAEAKISEPLGYLPKPCNVSVLMSTVETAFYKSEAEAARKRAAEETRELVVRLQEQQVELEAKGEELRGQSEALRESKAKLHEALARYADLYNGAPVGYLSLAEDGTIRQFNLAAARLLGGKPSRMAGSRFGLFVPEAGRPLLNTFLGEVSAGKGQMACDLEYVSASGRRGWMHIEAVAYDNGRECRLAVQDISEQKQAEELLLRSRDYYLQIFEYFPTLIWRAGLDAKCDYFNRTWLDFTGRSLEQEMGDGWAEGVHPDDIKRCLATYLEAFQRQEPFAMEYRLRHRDGSYRWLMDHGRPFFDLDHTFAGFIGSCYDISDQKRMVAQLRESEERFRQLFERSDDAIILFERDNCAIIDLNGVTENLFGFSRDALLTAGFPPFVGDDYRSRFTELVRGLGKSGSLQVDKVEMIRRDGASLWISVRGKLITLLDKKVVYCSFRDITKRISLEEEAKAAQAKLIQADKMASLGLLVSGIAHEINNPNNAIMFNSELLAKAWQSVLPILDEYARENGDFKVGDFQFSESREILPKLFSGMRDSAGRIKNIVARLKNFARQDQGSTLGRVDVNTVVLEAIAILNHEIKKQCDNFSFTAGVTLPSALGSAQQIEQVVINLLMNALQALPDRQRAIRISTTLAAEGEQVAIAVTDEGAGMPAEVLGRLTEPFFTTRGSSGGTGLGLSITASILKENHGTISFVSEPGKGTTATVLLRIFPDETPTTHRGTPA